MGAPLARVLFMLQGGQMRHGGATVYDVAGRTDAPKGKTGFSPFLSSFVLAGLLGNEMAHQKGDKTMLLDRKQVKGKKTSNIGLAGTRPGDMADSSSANEESAPSKGWGGWGFSVLSELQKAAAQAADEISRNASVVARNVVSDLQIATEPLPESVSEDEVEVEHVKSQLEPENKEDKRRKAALERLENASQESLLGQGLKVFDSSVENIASGAWQAFGSAWKGRSKWVEKIEHSAANLADTFQQGGLPIKASSLAPTLLESGKAITAKGMQVLEFVGRETIDLLATETGIEIEKDERETEQGGGEEQFSEEATFDRCFYIYGGPEQLEELEALSNHYALLCNRTRTKLPGEEKATFDGMVKQIQQIFTLSNESDGGNFGFDKGKNVESGETGNGNETKTLSDASVSKAAEMAAGFTATLGGLALNEIVQKTTDRLEAIRAEGVHRLSELCCLGISQLLLLGKSVLSASSKAQGDNVMEGSLRIDWPDDYILKAKLIRSKAQSMASEIEAVSNSFTTGISDVIAAFREAIKHASKAGQEARQEILQESSIENKAQTLTGDIESDGSIAIEKIQDGLQHLVFVVFSTTLKN
ncbi:hypothetical protein KI387_028433 [Taxus chinensis]|uniref:DUF7798 domain-containing protein n=1 Tax=Taxus chinensis TaxID=29808 RepID=A0AA38C807_TAXCH|nr:hypothetical protein KI387_028433 [Taxus chinensis]